MKRLLVVALAVTATASFAQVWDSGPGLGWSIPDSPGGLVSWTFTPTGVSGALTQFDISMSPNDGGVVHTWRSDLVISLKDPFGNVVTLQNQNGGSFDYLSAFYADTGIVDPNNTNLDSNTTGIIYKPQVGTVGALSQGAGVWTLSAQDLAGGDTGTIGRIKVHTAGVPEPATLSALGLGALALLRRRRKA
jgi:hypothetical protein